MKSSRQLSKTATNFIDTDFLTGLINHKTSDRKSVRDIIAKSLAKEALSVEETAMLLRADDPDIINEIYEAAKSLKKTVYGNRIVLFAPLYIGNDCINDCTYCAFKRSNEDVIRRTLSETEIKTQVHALESTGHKRLILVFGEHPHYGPEYIADCVRTVYETRAGHDEIRRVNINAAPLDHDGYKIVKDSGIGTYQIFQETYHLETYRKYHPVNTLKGDYLYRLDGLSRAFEAGCDDMGIGALFGLYDWKFEVLGLVSHALHLQKLYNVGPHTISFPRLQPASGVDLDPRYLVDDESFKRLIAILRLAVPYTGLILTARESPEIRRAVLEFGVSQIDAGTRLEIGGYTEVADSQCMDREQFSLGDIRSLDEVMGELIRDGYLPSFCTACYRLGRTGEHFMEFAIPGFIKRYCSPNAIVTLKEYLLDYGSPETQADGDTLIQAELNKISEPEVRAQIVERLKKIEDDNERDLIF